MSQISQILIDKAINLKSETSSLHEVADTLDSDRCVARILGATLRHLDVFVVNSHDHGSL